MDIGTDGRSASLMAVHERQLPALQALMACYSNGTIDYDRIGEYLPQARRLLSSMEVHESRWPGDVEIHAVAGPLVQGLSMYADWMDSAGERQQAVQLRLEADQIAARHLTELQSAGYLRTRAMEAAAAGRFQEALVGLEGAQEAFLSGGRPIDAAQTQLQLANVFEWLGDYGRALSIMDSAQALVSEQLSNGPPSRFSVGAAIVRQLQGILRDGAAQEREGEDALYLRRILFELVQGRARVSRRLGRFEQARALFEEARPFVTEFVPGGVDFHLAAIAIDTGDLDSAAIQLDRIAPEFDQGLMRPRRGALRLLQSDLALGRGAVADSLAFAAMGLAEQDNYPDLELAWKLQWRSARALARAGRDEESLAAYIEAARVADTVRLAPLGYVLDTAFVADKLPMVEEAIDLAVASGDGIVAAELMELVKARALAAVLSRPAAPGFSGGADDIRFDALSQEIDSLSFRMYAGEATPEQARRRIELLRERREVLERIRIRDPRWRGLSVPPAVDVDVVCRRLGRAGQAALVLHLREGRLVAALLSGDGVVVGQKVWDESTSDAVREYAENLTLPNPDYFLFDFSGACQVDLDDLLPASVVSALARSRTLLVVPHGALHVLPWATMTLGGQRLFSTRAVGLLPNLAAFTQAAEHLNVPTRIGLVGDPVYFGLDRYKPLPQAGAELTDLADLYGPAALVAPVARRGDAREETLAQMLPRGVVGSVLHVVCHADVAPDEPLSSGLILTGSTLDSGEILRLGCGFPEVVLSACSTGWRPQTAHGLELAGDDALGLVASFLEAGAESLIVSVTQAKDDVARKFMVTWHGHRRGGASPLQAFQRTQIQMAESGQPIWTWAGISLYGRV